jgi:hypothetical protein
MARKSEAVKLLEELIISSDNVIRKQEETIKLAEQIKGLEMENNNDLKERLNTLKTKKTERK